MIVVREDFVGCSASRNKATCENRRTIKLAAIESRIVAAIEAGGDPRSLASRLNELEAERREIVQRAAASRGGDVVALHPNAADRYRAKVADIHAALSKGDEAARTAISLVRELIETITVTPCADGGPMHLELAGNLAALMAEPSGNKGAIVSVAGPRNHH